VKCPVGTYNNEMNANTTTINNKKLGPTTTAIRRS
jgi:hypothetical protein